eukprot:4657941-Pyramimonas_sp.AAC.1
MDYIGDLLQTHDNRTYAPRLNSLSKKTQRSIGSPGRVPRNDGKNSPWSMPAAHLGHINGSHGPAQGGASPS